MSAELLQGRRDVLISLLSFLRYSLREYLQVTLCNTGVALCNTTVAVCNTSVALCNSLGLTVALCNSFKPCIFCKDIQFQAGFSSVGVYMRTVSQIGGGISQIAILNQGFEMTKDGCPINAEKFGEGIERCPADAILHLAESPGPAEDGRTDQAIFFCH